MKDRTLFRTNLLISITLIIGFTLTAFLGFRANYLASLKDMQQVSNLTAEGIYYKLTESFAKPVNVSLAMAHDSLLKDHLYAEPESPDEEDYIATTIDYLKTYQEKYKFDSVFLVSTATSRYYNFNGLDRVLAEGDPENVWYYDFLAEDIDYFINVDNDEVAGADNSITVFVNCKVIGDDGSVLGVVGVGLGIDYLKDILKSYEDEYNIIASLVSEDGSIELSTTYTGYENKDWFETYEMEAYRNDILSWMADDSNLKLWCSSSADSQKSILVTRYVPELSWHLIIEQNTGILLDQIMQQFYLTLAIIAAVIFLVTLIVTTVIRNFNKRITQLAENRKNTFQKATEELYDNIYELNISKNCSANKKTQEYFNSLGAAGLPYDQALHAVANRQIKEEFREGYLNTFSPENVIKEYESGNTHLRYDFMMTEDGTNYFWMRIDVRIFYSAEDNSIHMFTYRKNIDAEKKMELKAMRDGMTGLLNKKETEHAIEQLLSGQPSKTYAFFIFDIDNFKMVNDRFGHAFGDYCIQSFASVIRRNFRNSDIIGRIGGDEFAAFIPVPDQTWLRSKTAGTSQALHFVCSDGKNSWQMSASIGVALFPKHGTDFDSLYRNADTALYETKKRGKNGYTIFSL